MSVKPIPEGYHSVTPYLTVHDGNAALAFYEKAFGATVLMKMPGEDGRIMHAEIRIGDSMIMLSDEFPEMGARSPKTLGGAGGSLMIYLPDVDAVWKRSLAAGGVERKALADQFYGDRSGTLVDPFGHVWTLSTHVEDVSPEEMERRAAAFMKKAGEQKG